jgi:hypothetical protein
LHAGPGRGGRQPDLGPIPGTERRQALPAVVAVQPIADHLPAFDRVLIDGEQNRIRIRPVDPAMAEIHSYVRRYVPARMPTLQTGEVFDRSGRLLRRVMLPVAFSVRTVQGWKVVAFLELDSGEPVIGVGRLPV